MRHGFGAATLRLLCFLIVPAAAAQEPAEAAFAPPAQLGGQLDELVRPMDGERDIRVGVCLWTLDGEPVYEYRADEEFVLASNMKLPTTAAALLELPADYRWETRSWLESGRLWIRGGGDPSLRVLPEGDAAADWLDALSAALTKAGVRELREVVVDVDFFDREWRHPLWPPEQWQAEYEAPVSALGFHGNCVQIEVVSAGRARLTPELLPPLELRTEASARHADFRTWWSRADKRMQVILGDRATGRTRVAVQDPAEFARRFVAAGLELRGWPAPVRLATRQEVRPAGEPVHVRQSAWTLAEAVVVANKESDNWVSEMIYKTLAANRDSGAGAARAGSSAGGAEAVRAAFAAAGAMQRPFRPADGSGMARDRDQQANLGTPAALCELLTIMAHVPEGRVFFESLLVGGEEGRLEQLFSEPLFQYGRVRAKTGWIIGASSLSGYLLAGDSQLLAFSVVVNYRKDNTARTNNARFRNLQKAVLAEALRAWDARN